MRVELLFEPFEASSALDRFTADAKDYGAVVSFTGVRWPRNEGMLPLSSSATTARSRSALDRLLVRRTNSEPRMAGPG